MIPVLTSSVPRSRMECVWSFMTSPNFWGVSRTALQSLFLLGVLCSCKHVVYLQNRQGSPFHGEDQSFLQVFSPKEQCYQSKSRFGQSSRCSNCHSSGMDSSWHPRRHHSLCFCQCRAFSGGWSWALQDQIFERSPSQVRRHHLSTRCPFYALPDDVCAAPLATAHHHKYANHFRSLVFS